MDGWMIDAINAINNDSHCIFPSREVSEVVLLCRQVFNMYRLIFSQLCYSTAFKPDRKEFKQPSVTLQYSHRSLRL